MQFHHIAMEVSDIKNSITFYKEILSFQEESSLHLLGEQITFLTLDGMRIELIENKTLKHRCERMHICFRVKNIKHTIKELTSHGLSAIEDPYSLENGWKIVFFKGPDGEILEFLES